MSDDKRVDPREAIERMTKRLSDHGKMKPREAREIARRAAIRAERERDRRK